MMNKCKLGIMQPYFFPYIGYFSLIQCVDNYIYFDTPQYERRGWMNRNRILNPNGDFTYITVPIVKSSQKTAICDIKIDNSQNWKDHLYSQLNIYKKKAPFYNQAMEFLTSALEHEFNTLSELNIFTTKAVCDYIGIKTKTDIFSKMKLDCEDTHAPDEWALNITKALGYEIYVNAIGGMEFFDKSKYTDAGIDLLFLKPQIQPYVQRIGRFVEGLSIIDVMMFNSKEQIKDMLAQYTLVN